MTAPYEKFETNRLILRDHLAADRTVLANERTFLAYIRTSLTVLIAGLTLVQFFDMSVMRIIGVSLLPFSAIVFIIGLIRYLRVRRMLRAVRK